uniref:Phenylalanine--tRNA ligase beta subunit n=1 Tax=Aceria tosichella TaxID=561515 RepID=A0A6G1SD82_9ACAR
MPTISVKRDLLMQKLGTTYTDEQFDELCFQFGIELDEITSEKKMAMKEKNATGQESDDVIYKIDLPANRYDLVCLEGLVLALKIFTGKMKPPDYQVRPSGIKFTVDEHAHAVRPVLLGAVVRNVQFNKDLYESFIDLQDKIHQNIGRKRAMVSVGTHDLDTIQAPFHYTAMKPNELKFVPLNQDKEFTASELMTVYEQTYLKPYLPLIKDKPEYPVIVDKNMTVLSMPPIINGNVSKITMDTKNVLIEITATDRAKATIALDTIVTMLSSSNNSYAAESVEVVHTDGRKYVSPDLRYQRESVTRSYINRGLGIDLSSYDIANLLTKMGIKTKPMANGEDIELFVPPTRHDIIHKCDVMEDVGIAYGYDNIAKTLPQSATIASQVPLNKLSDQLRNEVARCGYTEALNFALCSEDELSTMLNRTMCDRNLVRIQNPKTAEFQVARTCLLPGLLKTINSNKKMPLPMKLFEVGDVVLGDSSKDVGARNERHLAAIYYGKQTSGFEIIHGLLDRVMQVLACPYIGEQQDRAKCKRGYYIEADQKDGAFLSGRCATVVYNGSRIGNIGILHPDVLKNYDLGHPASALEINIEKCGLE